MATNDEQIAFLDYFCDEKRRFDYAVLIDAPWGSGKTHFLKDYLKRKYPPSTTIPPAPEYLWVSLFGRTNASEVRDALFAEAHPMLSSKWATLAGSALSGAAKKFTGFDPSDKKITKSFLPDIKAKLIVFDDLERTYIGAANALGLINSFVESGDFKVIVIANQEPIAGDKDYRSQKEKVIGRTLTVRSDPGSVLSEFTKSLQDGRARDAVVANRDDVLAVFRASGYDNLRSLRAALDDFDRLVAKSDPRLAAAPDALRELLLYLTAIGMEVRADKLQGETLQQSLGAICGLRSAMRMKEKKAEAEPESDWDMVNRKYPIVRWQNPVIGPGIIGRLITGGVLPLQEINEGLAVHPLVVGANNVPAWRALWNWIRLTASEYTAARTTLLDQLANHSIAQPGEILHVVGALIWLEEFADKLVPDVESYFLRYIDKILVNETLVPETGVFDEMHSDSWADLVYQKNEHPTFTKVRAHLQKAVGSAHRLEMAKQADKLLHRLGTPGSERALYECDKGSGLFGGVALLQNIAVGDFADILLKDFSYDSRLIAALRQRYDVWGRIPELIEEKSWLVDLEAELRRRTATAPAPFNLLLAQRTDYWFTAIRRNMEDIEAVAASVGAAPSPTSV